MTLRASTLTSLALTALTATSAVGAQVNTVPRELATVTVVERLGNAVPREARFTDHTGNAATLGQFFDGRRPVVLNLVYHRCTMLCSMVLNGVIRALAQTAWSVGDQYDVVTISIDPRDTWQTAAAKRERVLRAYGRDGAARGWHFLVGSAAESQRVADAVGFRYRFDERTREYAHPAATMLLTPDGRVARYLYGIEYPRADVRLALLDASQGRQVTTVERLIMFCYHYDPQGQRYALMAKNVMKLGGVATIAGLGSFLGVLWLRERRRKSADPVAAATTG